jgi:hypothetical protein
MNQDQATEVIADLTQVTDDSVNWRRDETDESISFVVGNTDEVTLSADAMRSLAFVMLKHSLSMRIDRSGGKARFTMTN